MRSRLPMLGMNKKEHTSMSETTKKLCGLSLIIVSIFLLLAGLYLPATVAPPWMMRILDAAGLLFLIGGLIAYKVLKT